MRYEVSWDLQIIIHKFIPKYTHVARPINQLVYGENANKKKAPVEWTDGIDVMDGVMGGKNVQL